MKPTDIWQEFIQTELKTGSKLGKLFEKSGFCNYEKKDNKNILTLYFPDEASKKSAQGQLKNVQDKLRQKGLLCDRINFRIGEVPKVTTSQNTTTKQIATNKINNPLQALILSEFGKDNRGEELTQPVLKAAATAENNCNSIYDKLKQRTQQLIGQDGVTLPVSFNWRLRVGGTRGFRELLLPVFHPVFGVPYIPASTLKGVTRAWAKKAGNSQQVLKLLGMLDGSKAIAAKVEFLDAFPVKPCLSVDVATPQWTWKNGKVSYKPEPHPLLSMEQPEVLIGLRPTILLEFRL